MYAMSNVEQAIQTLLSSSSQDERREAAVALGECREPKALQALVEALNDSDEEVLPAVIAALGETGNNDTVKYLLLPRFLHHPNSNIRWAVLKTLGKISQTCIGIQVAELVEDGEWVVRNEALKLIRHQTQILLKDCPQDQILRMASLLTSPNKELRDVLTESFLQIGPQIKPLLLDILETGGPEVKKAMAFITGKLRIREAVPILIGLSRSPDKAIRKNAVAALGEIGDETAILPLIERFGDPNREIQLAAFKAVGKFGKPAMAPLHEQLHYSSRRLIKQNALYALAEIRDPSSIPYFIKHLGSTYFVVRRAAINGLIQYGQEGVPYLLEVIRNLKLPLVDELLVQAEKGDSLGIRVRAIRALGELADHRAVHLMKRLSADKTPDIQKAAVEALAKIGLACWQRCAALAVFRELRIVPDVDLVIEQLQDDSENVRLRAIQVLGNGGNLKAVPALLNTAVNDPSIPLRYEALRAADELAPAHPEVKKTAIVLLEAPCELHQLKAEAIRIIGRAPEEKLLGQLVNCLKCPSWEVRRNAALALGNLGKPALPLLLERLKQGEETEIESVIRAIGNVGVPETIPAIEEAVRKFDADSRVLYSAKKAIADIQGKVTNRVE